MTDFVDTPEILDVCTKKVPRYKVHRPYVNPVEHFLEHGRKN
jgi:hypothetical protein